MTSNPLHPLGTEPRVNYRPMLSSFKQYLCDDFPEADQFFNNNFATSLGCGSFEHAFPVSFFAAICRERHRPAADIIQSSRLFPTIPGESVNDRKRRAEFHDEAQKRISDCFTFAKDISILGPNIRHQFDCNPPRTLAELIARLEAAYSEADITVINGLKAQMQLPLNPQASIHDDITNMLLIKDELPISHSTAWTDFALIDAFHLRLRLEERVAVDAALNVVYPNQLTRTWDQYKIICAQQVKIYRLTNPAVATAASAKVVESGKALSEFCFGCNQAHDPNTCAIVAAIIAAHPEYRQELRAKRTDPIRIPQDGHTLLVPPGFALVFNTHNKKPDHYPRSRPEQSRGRGGRGGRGGKGRGRPAVAATAAEDVTADPYTADYDADTVTTMSDF